MLGCKPQISGVGSDRSTNWATTTVKGYKILCKQGFKGHTSSLSQKYCFCFYSNSKPTHILLACRKIVSRSRCRGSEHFEWVLSEQQKELFFRSVMALLAASHSEPFNRNYIFYSAGYISSVVTQIVLCLLCHPDRHVTNSQFPKFSDFLLLSF